MMTTTYERNGLVYLASETEERIVAAGTSPRLTVTGGLRLWWLQGPALLSADVLGLQIANQVTEQPVVSGFAVHDVGDLGVGVAYTKDENLYLLLAGTTYTLPWDSTRERDFDFSFSADLQMLSVVYRIVEAGTTQAYLVQFVYRNDTYVVTDALFRVFDFRLGARPLDDNAAGLVA
jgi:hypothetical protein